MQQEFFKDAFLRLNCFALCFLLWASLWRQFRGGDVMKQQGDLFCHPKADGCPLLSRVSLLRATQMSSSASVFAADPPCVIPAVYSLKGFSLSRHLAPSLRPSASPAPHPGTQPLQLCTGGLWKWKTPCCWDTRGRKGARFTESTALPPSHSLFLSAWSFFSKAPCFCTGHVLH